MLHALCATPVNGDAIRTSACHCTFCQRRTGSAFGISVYFKEGDVEITRGTLQTYEHRSDETGRWQRLQFCSNCGTTLTWIAEALPGARAIAGGTFDDPKSLQIKRHTWMRSAHSWMVPPKDAEVFEQSSLQQPAKN
jgi:hypothetical protein